MEEIEQPRSKQNLWQLLSQWVYLPILTFLIGIVGTYQTQIAELQKFRVESAKDISQNTKDISNEQNERRSIDTMIRSEMDERVRIIAALMERLIAQNTEVIALFKVQQQLSK